MLGCPSFFPAVYWTGPLPPGSSGGKGISRGVAGLSGMCTVPGFSGVAVLPCFTLLRQAKINVDIAPRGLA